MLKRNKKLKPEKIGKFVEQFLSKIKDTSIKKEVIINKIWEAIVDSKITAHTKPESIRGTKLYVFVESSAWMNELTFLKKEINIKAQKEFINYGISITEVVFILGKR